MLTAKAHIALPDPGGLLNALGVHLLAHDIALRQDGDHASVVLPMGSASFEVAPTELTVETKGEGRADIETMIAFVASHIRELARPFEAEIVWTGDVGHGELFADFRELRVVRVTDIAPHMRRITFAGDDLARFDTNENLHVRLFIPPAGIRTPHWPRRGEDGLAAEIPLDLRPIMRRYTLRRVDVAKSEVEIDFVLHDDAGPGSAWATKVSIGDLCGIAGPGGLGVRRADWYLLGGDETALPAIARILESLPAEAEGVAIVEVGEPRDIIPLGTASKVDVRYIDRGGVPAGTTDSLVKAVGAIAPPTDRSSFIWIGCEFDAFRSIRTHLREKLGRKKDDHLVVAYWRKGRAEGE